MLRVHPFFHSAGANSATVFSVILVLGGVLHKVVALTLVSYLQSCPQPIQSPNTETKQISLKYKLPPVNFLSAVCTSVHMLALGPATLLPSSPGLPSGVSSADAPSMVLTISAILLLLHYTLSSFEIEPVFGSLIFIPSTWHITWHIVGPQPLFDE